MLLEFKFKEIVFSNGKRGVLLRSCGSFMTFVRVDKNGNQIFERSNVSQYKQKLFTISKNSLKTLVNSGDIRV